MKRDEAVKNFYTIWHLTNWHFHLKYKRNNIAGLRSKIYFWGQWLPLRMSMKCIWKHIDRYSCHHHSQYDGNSNNATEMDEGRWTGKCVTSEKSSQTPFDHWTPSPPPPTITRHLYRSKSTTRCHYDGSMIGRAGLQQ